MRKSRRILTCFLACLSCACAARAGSLSTTGHYGVDSAVILRKNSDIEFGTVKAKTADTYTISTTGKVTNSGSGAWLYGTPSAGSVTISGSERESINISVGNYMASNGVTLRNATCAYNGGAPRSCNLSNAAPPGDGKKLLIGVSAVVDGTQAPHTSAAPGFMVTVVYQ